MGYLKLTDAGTHSAGLNTTNQIVSATPEFVLTTPLEFTVSGGTAASPELQHAQSGLIGAGDELWLKPSGSDTLAAVTVGGVSESAGASGSLLPAMTGYTSGSITVSASSEHSSPYPAWKAFDGINASDAYQYWISAAGATTGWLKVDFGAAKTVTGYRLGTIDANGVKSWTFEGSNDGTNWTTLHTVTNSATTSGYTDYSLGSSATYRHYRLNISAGQGTAYINVFELQIIGPASSIYALSGLSPAQDALPEKAFKIRTDPSTPMMYLATGQTDEPLCKETALTLALATTNAATADYSTSSLSASAGAITTTADGNMRKSVALTGDCSVEAVIAAKSGSAVMCFGFTATAWTSYGTYQPYNSPTYASTYLVRDDGTILYTNASGTGSVSGSMTAPVTGTTVIKLVRSGSDISVYRDGSLVHTFATGTSAPLYAVFGLNNSSCSFSGAKTGAGQNTTSQLVLTGSSSLLSYLSSGNLSRDLIVTVGGVDYVLQPNGEVTETGSDPYTTTIPIPTQASAPTAAKLRSRFQTQVDIASITYAAGPELALTGEEVTLTDNPNLKRLALKLRSDVTATTQRARAAKIYTTEMPA